MEHFLQHRAIAITYFSGRQTIEMTAVTAFLTNNPGASVYFLVTLVALVCALILSIRWKQASKAEIPNHILPGVVILLLLQLLSLVVNALIWANPIQDLDILIIFDQSLSILGAIWLFWLLVPLLKRLLAVVLAGGFSLLILGMAIFGGLALFQPPPYNLYITAWVFYIWHLFAILFCLTGCIWLISKRPSAWTMSLAILLIALAGHFAQLLSTNDQLIPGIVRLSQMLYFPLLVIYMSKQFEPLPKPVQAHKMESQEPASGANESNVNLTPTVTASLLNVSLQKSRNKILNSLTHSISLFMMADICCLAIIDEETQAIQIKNGYDLIREDHLKDFEVNLNQAPELFNALENAQLLEIKNSRSVDAESIRTLTGYNQLGIVTFFPLKKNGDIYKSGLLFLTPYTFRQWNSEAFENLDKVSPTILRVIENSSEVEKQKLAAEGVLVSLNQANRENIRLQEKYDRCQELLTEIRNEFNASKVSHQEEIQQWIAQRGSLENEIQKLTEIAEKSRNALNDLNTLQSQKIELQKSLEQSNRRIASLKNTLLKTKTLIEESVSAQIDEESVVIPTIPDPIIKSETLPESKATDGDGTSHPKIRLIDMMESLQNEVQVIVDQKGLSLKISYANAQDTILTNRIEIEKIIRALLRNAIKVSPNGREVQVEFNLETDDKESKQLILQITDQGGGLSRQEQSTFFTMIERHGQPVPGGIGDVNALRDVISLVRLQKGKLWMKSGIEQPTTFKIQLPLSNEG